MNILITGANGFLGSHIKKVWERKNYNVLDLGRTNKNAISCNLSSDVPTIKEPIEYVIHLAGKAHMVPKTSAEKEAFYLVNTKGTENLLQGIEKSSSFPKGILFVSTVAVYGNTKGENITEDAPLNAIDPYGKSKIQAEKILIEWGEKHNIPISIIRPPLIIGKNAPGNLQKMIQGIKNKRYANIAGGKAKRSMVLAEDIANFTPTLVQYNGIVNVTDGYNPSFKEISKIIGNKFGKKVFNIPYFFAKTFGLTGDVLEKITKKEMPFSSNKLSKMTSSLTFSNAKASTIGWKPRTILENKDTWL